MLQEGASMVRALKILLVALICVFILGVVFSYFLGSFSLSDDVEERESLNIPPNLQALSYIDYAKEVEFDKATYPELADQGLFWTKWDSSLSKVVELDADSQEGAVIVDTSKPSVILVHGLMVDGHTRREDFYLTSSIAPFVAPEFKTTDSVSLIKLWLDNGWNVATFHYNRFAAESISYNVVESKIWATDGPGGVRFRYPDNTLSPNDASAYSIAEHFAAEYARAMSLLPESMGTEEIRITGHSMGGQLTAAGLFLISELVSVGQIPKRCMPNRYAMLDPFFGVNINGNSLSAKNINIRWTNRGLIENTPAATILECMRALVLRKVVIEYYAYKSSWLINFMTAETTKRIKEYSVYTFGLPAYQSYSPSYTLVTNGHTGISDWYLCSITAPPVKNITDPNVDNAFAASASTPTDYMGEHLVGIFFEIVDGSTTVNASDDTFIQRVDKTDA
jgi:hypothetical protein